MTSLHFAAKEGHCEIIQTLIDAGADVNALDGLYWSALDNAVEYRKIEAIKVLLKNGATKMILRHDLPKQVSRFAPPGWIKDSVNPHALKAMEEDSLRKQEETPGTVEDPEVGTSC
eukprot:TRINITY_DN7763_c0_g1_i5.p1 TRINITY_DN7763_c0_g1~~TRINITY_DN7763_c0_g1_i5.p1  ORF type:complete len:116 (-),score=8.55 TRINITY_DN7763_c0_g1_i5:240-587(-)